MRKPKLTQNEICNLETAAEELMSIHCRC